MWERMAILVNIRVTSQETIMKLKSSQSPINALSGQAGVQSSEMSGNTDTRDLAEHGQVPRNGVVSERRNLANPARGHVPI